MVQTPNGAAMMVSVPQKGQALRAGLQRVETPSYVAAAQDEAPRPFATSLALLTFSTVQRARIAAAPER